jgi:hypothetical protein
MISYIFFFFDKEISYTIININLSPLFSYALFGSRESEWMDRSKERKFMGERDSTVWFLCQRGKIA